MVMLLSGYPFVVESVRRNIRRQYVGGIAVHSMKRTWLHQGAKAESVFVDVVSQY
jgi:hypothetical protein